MLKLHSHPVLTSHFPRIITPPTPIASRSKTRPKRESPPLSLTLRPKSPTNVLASSHGVIKYLSIYRFDFEASEHGGTHMDAPYHFYKYGKFIGELTLENLIVPLIIVDVSSHVNGDPNFILYKHHLDYKLDNNDGKPCMIIFKFGWSQFYADRKRYLGINESDGALNFPGLSQEIAEWITTAFKNVVGVGVDVPSLDPGSTTDFAVHQWLLGASLFGMENVKLDTHVPEYGCTGIALPMKIAKGTGGPLRLVAICPKQTQTEF